MIGYAVLNNGMKMPAMGFGTDELTDDKEGMREAVKSAIDVGYRLIDTASVYKTEKFVGQAIKEKITEGVVNREDLFIVSKLWNTQHKFENVVPACKKSLEEMGLDYFDLYLINWPMDYPEEFETESEENLEVRLLGEVDYTETWRGMEECVKRGLARSIGLSNFNVNQIFRVQEHATIKPVVCQDECHVMLSQKRLRVYCKVNQITVMGYSPLGNPGYLESIDADDPKNIFDNSAFVDIAEKHNKTEAQVALRFLIDNEVVPIPKSTSIEHMRENIAVADFELTKAELKSLHNLDTQFRIRSSRLFERHPRFPFTGGYWD